MALVPRIGPFIPGSRNGDGGLLTLWRVGVVGHPTCTPSLAPPASGHSRGIGGTIAVQCRGSSSICCPASAEPRRDTASPTPWERFASTASEGNCTFPHSVCRTDVVQKSSRERCGQITSISEVLATLWTPPEVDWWSHSNPHVDEVNGRSVDYPSPTDDAPVA